MDAGNLYASPQFRLVEMYFALLGKRVRLSSIAMAQAWSALAQGDGPINRIFAIAFGYSIAGFCAAIYLNLLSVGSMQTAGRAIRNAIRQQMIIIKVREQ